MKGKRKRALRRAAAREAGRLMRGGMAAGLVAFGACSESHGRGLHASSASGGSPAFAADAGLISDAGALVRTMHPSSGGFAGASGKPMLGNPPDAGAAKRPAPSTDAVTRETLARDVLYSWTTQAQIAELRANPVLLTRSENSDGKQPHSSTVIAALGEQGDPLGKVLAGEAFKKGRYAWSNAWATVRGWPDESYGDQLLRIVLKPEAWIAVVEFGTIRVIDLSNRDVLPAQALEFPERIAAVYFVNEGSADPNACGTFASGCGTGAYREYFVNNESMVLEWSFGTPEIQDEILRSIDLIAEVTREIASAADANLDACEFSRSTYCIWLDQLIFGLKGEQFQTYQRSLALTSEFYLPTVANMDALRIALKAALATPDPLIHKP